MTLIPRTNVSSCSWHRWLSEQGHHTSELSKDLDKSSKHKALPPLRHLEHDHPTRRSCCLLSVNCELDLIELGLDPFIIRAIKVQLSKGSHPVIQLICRDEMSGCLRKPEHTQAQKCRWECLESQGETPLER